MKRERGIESGSEVEMKRERKRKGDNASYEHEGNINEKEK
jgi:hypothetical protein